jgi:hypothetical protein
MKTIKNITVSTNENNHPTRTVGEGSYDRVLITKVDINLIINKWYRNEMEKETLCIPFEVINERAEQGLDFLVNRTIQDCPLVENLANIREMSYNDAAEAFVSDKRDVNIRMTELDKIVWKYANLIEKSESPEELSAILDDFQNKHECE